MTGDIMSNAAQKTPISLLQELCAQQNLAPDYKLMSVEGAVHAPTFMYRVDVGSVMATATGASKKKAKHAVAKAVLEKLLSEEGGFASGFESDGVMITSESLQEFNVESVPAPCSDESALGNPVGRLQELCMKHRWQPPLYETEDESGLPHERVFRIACHVERFREIGEGKSKKLAKRQAADNMLQRLEKLDLTDEEKEESLEENMSKLNLGVSKEKVINSSSVESLYSKNVEKFLSHLKTSTNPCLTSLQEIDLNDDNVDCLKLLNNIGLEHDFDIKYIPLEERGKTGDYHCLVQIQSLPIAVCFGSGSTRDIAKFNCARNALSYIKLMSSK